MILIASIRLAYPAILCGLLFLNSSCKQTRLLTAYVCEQGVTIRADGAELTGVDPFAGGNSTDADQFDDLLEPWTVVSRFQLEADSDFEPLLNYKAIPNNDRASTVPMSPYKGALVFEGVSGNRPVLIAVKTDNETIRISNTRRRDPSTFVLGAADFDDLCYISNGYLAAKILLIIKQNKPEMATPRTPSD